MSEIVDGYGSDLDYYITEGSTLGLTRIKNLFTELQPTSANGGINPQPKE